MHRKLLPLTLALLLSLAVFSEARAQPAESAASAPGTVLSHAYPNPFTSSTTFDLTLQQRQSVRVEVFNVLGQRVAKLYDGDLTAEVRHRFSFDAEDLPPGIYLYRATGETFTRTRRVMRVP